MKNDNTGLFLGPAILDFEQAAPTVFPSPFAPSFSNRVPANRRSPYQPLLSPLCLRPTCLHLHQQFLYPLQPPLLLFSPSEEQPCLMPSLALELYPLLLVVRMNMELQVVSILFPV